MKRKPPNPKQPVSRLFSYLAGLASGLFLAFLYALVTSQPPPDAPATDPEPVPAQNIELKTERIDWSFYDLFPKAEVANVGGYQSAKRASDPKPIYHLQAGSFNAPRDADERRAELLMLGLTAFIETKPIKGVTWHRVMIGPFESDTNLNRAQSLLAANNFESIPISTKP